MADNLFEKSKCTCPATYNPVCGRPKENQDSLPYFISFSNSCIANCQNFDNERIGKCIKTEDIVVSTDIEDYDGNEDTEIDVIETLEDNVIEGGFYFVGKIDNEDKRPSKDYDNHSGKGWGNKENFMSTMAVRVTRRGNMYVAPPDTLFNASKQDYVPPDSDSIDRTVPEITNNFNLRGRRLSIIGADTRTEKNPTWVFPFFRIGELDYGVYEGGCTGTVIGPKSVLTAAHCVYDLQTKKWTIPSKFAPGRMKEYGTWEPWGTWEVDFVTTFSAYTQDEDINYDIAVLEMKPNGSGRKIGDVMGTLPMVPAPATNSIEDNSEIIGYPADKLDGSMWRSGNCEEWFHASGVLRFYHRCDTFSAQSGGPAINGNGYVFGEHTHGAGSSSWNSGVALTESLINLLVSLF